MAENKDEIVEEKIVSEAKSLDTDHYYHYHEHARKAFIVGLGIFLILLAGLIGLLTIGRYVRGREVTNTVRNQVGFNIQGRRGMMGGGRMMFGLAGNAIQGKVTAVDGQKLTVDVSGTSKTVQVGTDTRFPINSTTKINVGDTVSVTGEQDSNGVIQAVRIVVNPTSIN